MRYKLVDDSKNDYKAENVQNDILKNRGINNPQEYLTVDRKSEIPYTMLNNIHKAISCLLKHIKNNDTIYIQPDCDVDGMTSSSALYLYLKRVYPNINIVWDIREGKIHGVDLKQIPKDVKLVIIPDAGSNQYDEHYELHNKGIDVIVLDHHEADIESKYAIVVNNQLSKDYSNKNLSGVGVVYKFLQALDDELWLNYADDYLDLVALGNIADVMDLRNMETRYYVNKGLQQVKNEFFRALLDKQEYSTKGKLNPISIAFYIAPLINALIRVGSTDDKKELFKAFIGSDEKFMYQPRRKKEDLAPPDPVEEDIYAHVSRLCVNAKAKQTRIIDKAFKIFTERIEEQGLDKNKIIILEVTGELEGSMTGLMAQNLSSHYMKPCLVIREREKDHDLFGGSGRGLENSELKDFKEFINSLKLFNFAQGHPNAFGVEFKKEDLPKIIKKSNTKLKNMDFDKVYTVDYIVPFDDVSDELIGDIHRMEDIWCQGAKESFIAILGIDVDTNNINLIGDKKTTLKFEKEGLEFIKFKTDNVLYDSLVGDGWDTTKTHVVINVVGKCNINEFDGRRTPQIIIEDLEIIG